MILSGVGTAVQQQVSDLEVTVPAAPSVLPDQRYPLAAAHPGAPGEQVNVAGVTYRVIRMREFEGALITYYERIDTAAENESPAR